MSISISMHIVFDYDCYFCECYVIVFCVCFFLCHGYYMCAILCVHAIYLTVCMYQYLYSQVQKTSKCHCTAIREEINVYHTIPYYRLKYSLESVRTVRAGPHPLGIESGVDVSLHATTFGKNKQIFL